MDNQDIHSPYYELISRYLSGNASPSEIEALETWVMAAPENKAVFQDFKKAWMLTGLERDQQTVQVDKLWKQTSDQLFSQGKVLEMKPPANRRRWTGLAAAIVLVLIASFWFFQNTSNDSFYQVASSDEVKSFDLADGSHITLNQSSSLTYDEQGDINKRRVALTGDAFFEVARDENRPFIIKAQGIEVEVLGTSFYIDSREGEAEIQVIVESGKVAVRANGKEQILLAEEKAIFQKNTQALTKEKNDDSNFLAIKNKTLVFEDTKLADVVFALNRYFHADISIEDDALKTCPLTGIYPDKSLPAILKLIEASLGINIQQKGSEIIFSGVCNY